MKDGRILDTKVRGITQGSKAQIFEFIDGEHITHIDIQYDDGAFRFIRLFTCYDMYQVGDKKYLKPMKDDVSRRQVKAIGGRYNKNRLEALFFYYTESQPEKQEAELLAD
jgi:hypothetical protein